MNIFKGLKKHIFLLILLSSMLSFFSLQIAVYISYAIDGVLFHNSEKIPEYLKPILEMNGVKGLMTISFIMIGMYLAIVLITYRRERITTDFTLKICSNLKKTLYAHILNLEYESYHSYSKVEMLQRVNEDAEEYAKFFKTQFNLILDIVSLSFFMVSQSIFLSTSITMYLILTIVVMLGFSFWYYRKMTQILEKVIIKKRKMLGLTIDNINRFKFVRIYNRQKEEIQKYKRLNKEYTQEDLKLVKLILFYEIVSEHITYLSDPIICLLGGISVIKGTMTFGTLSALLLFATKILNCLYTFGENLEVINSFIVVRQKIKKLMNLKEEKNEKYTYNLDGDIIFHNVSIGIAKKEMVTNLNLTIRKGEKVAIFGKNGSGKSIFAKAILGFYPVKGNIYFNYHNSKQLNKSNIREYVDYVLGEVDLFTGTLQENIELGEKSAEEKLIKVTKEAEMEQDISRLEEGYQTIVGEKGIKLSGGQKQRTLIARALIRNKPIIIFDNAFSKLDHKTTEKIWQNLVKKYPQTTMIFITHKAEIQNYVDKIIEIKEGEGEL